MKCPRCLGKGYLEDWYHYGDRARPMLKQCCDVTAYSKRVQELQRLGEAFAAREIERIVEGGRKPCPVIPLRRS